MFSNRRNNPINKQAHEDLYFEVVTKLWGIREKPWNVVYFAKEPDRPVGPDGPVFRVTVKTFQDSIIKCLPRKMLWELLAEECGKIWPVVMEDDSGIKASLALENRQLIGGFRGSNGLVFWLCHDVEK